LLFLLLLLLLLFSSLVSVGILPPTFLTDRVEFPSFSCRAREATSYAIEYSRPLAALTSASIAINPFVNTTVIFSLNSVTSPTSPTSFTKHDVLAMSDTFCFCYTCQPPPAPAAPTSSSLGTSWIAVNWTAVTSDPLTPVTSYTLSMDNGSGGSLNVVYVGSELSFNATGLQTGTIYAFAVAATNVMGTGSNSAIASFSTTASPPPAPTNLVAMNTTSSSVALSWTAPPSGALPILNYTVQYSLTSPVSFATAGVSTVTSFNVTGLAAYTTYVFQVAASNQYGMSPYSSNVTFRTNALNPTVVNSANLSIPIPSPTSSSSITINWAAATYDGGAAILYYVLQVSNLTSTPTPYTTIYTGLALIYNHTNLWRNTTYQYRVGAVNSVGASNFTAGSAIATTFQTPPSSPLMVTTSSVSTKWIALSWTSPIDDGGSTSLWYAIALDGSLVGTATATQFNVTGLQRSSTYNFTVTAINPIGSGPNATATFNTSDCASSSDCSSAGTCSSLGTCQCNSGYAGLYCEVSSGKGNLTSSIDPGEFPFSIPALGGLYTLYWSYDVTANTITIGIVAKGSGWVGIGFGSQMAGADIVIGSIGPTGISTANDYYSYGETTPQLDTTLGGTDGLLAYNGQFEQTSNGPVTTLKFTRYIQSSDPYDHSLDVSKSAGTSSIIVAFNPTSTALDYHGINYREALQVNWASGASSKAPLPATRIAHGTLMTFGWLGIIFGAVFARYVRWLRRSKVGDAWWFHVHQWNQIFWFLVIIAGFILAFVANAILKAPHLTSNAAHGVLGVLVVCLAVLQVVWAFFRPHPVKDDEGRFLKKQPCIRILWQQLHHWIGRVAMILSIPTVLLGMYAARAPAAVYAVYGAIIGLFVVLIVIMEICMVTKKSDPRSDTSKTELTSAIFSE